MKYVRSSFLHNIYIRIVKVLFFFILPPATPDPRVAFDGGFP